jgi:hypothetical protein
VKERIDDEVPVIAAQPYSDTPGLDSPDVLAVGAHDTLGFSGRARGEQNVRDVIGADLLACGRNHARADGIATRDELVESFVGSGRTRENDHTLERGQRFAAEQFRVANTQELTDGEQQSGAAPAKDVAGFFSFQPRVERYQDAARRLRSDGHRNPFGNVWGPYRDALALAQAVCQKSRSYAAAEVLQLGERQARVAIVDGNRVRMPPRGSGHYLGDRRGLAVVRHYSWPLACAARVRRCE